MLVPGLQVVEREGVGEFRCELRVSVFHDCGVACVFETVELSSPGASQSSGVVHLYLLRGRYLI